MNILIEGKNLDNYYAKVHVAWRKGLSQMFGAKCYGRGYENYSEAIETFEQMKEAVFQGGKLDLLILTDCWDPLNLTDGFRYRGIEELDCKKAIMLCDFWSEAEANRAEYFNFIESNGIDFILTFFRMPFYLWKDFDISKKLIWFPVCFDPDIFNDWGQEKVWEVGNLNAGAYSANDFYPERYQMHRNLLGMEDVQNGKIKYFYAKHPGSGMLPADTPLIGKDFSEKMGACKIFVTSGSLQYRNFNPKYVEAMASKTCLFANEPLDADLIGLADGVNYVKIDEGNFVSKINYYLEHEDERACIAENGYLFVMERYSCYAQAVYVYKQLAEKMGIRRVHMKGETSWKLQTGWTGDFTNIRKNMSKK